MSDTFHEVLFPEDISYGSTGGPAFSTTIIDLASGYEQRNINWSKVKASYEASHGVKTREQMEELLDFFYARMGKAYGFRFKDWMDYVVEDELLGVGDGATKTFQMQKTYESGTGYAYVRTLNKIAPDTTVITVDGVEAAFTIDVNTGLVTLTATPAADKEVRIAYAEFHVPVRFDTDEMKVSQDSFETMSWPSIPLVELRIRAS